MIQINQGNVKQNPHPSVPLFPLFVCNTRRHFSLSSIAFKLKSRRHFAVCVCAGACGVVAVQVGKISIYSILHFALFIFLPAVGCWSGVSLLTTRMKLPQTRTLAPLSPASGWTKLLRLALFSSFFFFQFSGCFCFCFFFWVIHFSLAKMCGRGCWR